MKTHPAVAFLSSLAALLVAFAFVGCQQAGTLDVPPKFDGNPPLPIYPEDMKNKGLTDTVVVQFVVNKDGSASQAQAIQFRYPEAAKAAVDTILRTHFIPGMKNGMAVNCTMRLPVYFNLEDVEEQPPRQGNVVR